MCLNYPGQMDDFNNFISNPQSISAENAAKERLLKIEARIKDLEGLLWPSAREAYLAGYKSGYYAAGSDFSWEDEDKLEREQNAKESYELWKNRRKSE